MARKANGAAIRSIREGLGLSQGALGARIGISAAAVSYVENGGGMRLDNLRKTADVLGCPLDAITIPVPEPQAVNQ